MKLTQTQRRVLLTCKRDVSIIIGSIDATPNVRRDVVRKLAGFGLIKWWACDNMNAESEWRLTEEGKRLAEELSQ